jgi:peptidoglycan/LPS O-acetylase OafA/YrhL
VIYIKPLTSLRFFAAFAVAAYHLKGAFGYDINHISFFPAITFFFVLSGFILAHVHPSFPDRTSVGRYYVSRIARIWPLHLVTIGYFLWFIAVPSNGVVIANLLLLQSWSMELETAMSMNGVAWSISVEVFFYLLLPAIVATRQYWPLWLLGSAAVVTFGMVMATNAGELEETMRGASWLNFLHVGPPARFLEFLAGVLTAMVFRRVRKPDWSFWTWTLLEAIVVAAVAVACWVDPWLTLSGFYFPSALYVWFYCSGTFPLMCLAVLCFAYGSGAISRGLSWRPLVFMGEISFAIYMVHQLVLVTWLVQGRVPKAWDPAALALIAAQILSVSALTYLLVERPAKVAALAAYARLAGLRSIGAQTAHPGKLPPR